MLAIMLASVETFGDVVVAVQFREFERLVADQTQVRVLGHDEAGNGWIVAHVGCTSKAAKRRLEKRWA